MWRVIKFAVRSIEGAGEFSCKSHQTPWMEGTQYMCPARCVCQHRCFSSPLPAQAPTSGGIALWFPVHRSQSSVYWMFRFRWWRGRGVNLCTQVQSREWTTNGVERRQSEREGVKLPSARNGKSGLNVGVEIVSDPGRLEGAHCKFAVGLYIAGNEVEFPQFDKLNFPREPRALWTGFRVLHIVNWSKTPSKSTSCVYLVRPTTFAHHNSWYTSTLSFSRPFPLVKYVLCLSQKHILSTPWLV